MFFMKQCVRNQNFIIMKSNRTFELPIENTILYISHNSIKDYTKFVLKFTKLGFKSTDPLEMDEDDVCQIVLKENKGISQKKWDKLIRYLRKNDISFNLKLGFNSY